MDWGRRFKLDGQHHGRSSSELLSCSVYVPWTVHSHDGSPGILTETLGEKYIRAKKLIRGATDLMYVTTELEYNLHSEDVRVVSMSNSELVVRKSARQAVIASSAGKKTYLLIEKELNVLKERCWTPM
jgi:hypothetical protein